MWDDDKSERSLDPYPEQFRVRCKKFHADLRPWSSLPEARREEYRAQGEAVLAEVRKRTGAGS